LKSILGSLPFYVYLSPFTYVPAATESDIFCIFQKEGKALLVEKTKNQRRKAQPSLSRPPPTILQRTIPLWVSVLCKQLQSDKIFVKITKKGEIGGTAEDLPGET